jgi:hypothetical protein
MIPLWQLTSSAATSLPWRGAHAQRRRRSYARLESLGVKFQGISASVAALLLSLPASAVTHKDWILVTPAGSSAQSLLTENKEADPPAQAARRAADDPYPDAGALRLIQAAHVRDEQEWEQAFAADMGSAFRGRRRGGRFIRISTERRSNSRRLRSCGIPFERRAQGTTPLLIHPCRRLILRRLSRRDPCEQERAWRSEQGI